MIKAAEIKFRHANHYFMKLFHLGAMVGQGQFYLPEEVDAFQKDWAQVSHAWRWVTSAMYKDPGICRFYLLHYKQGIMALLAILGPKEALHWSEKAVEASRIAKEPYDKVFALSRLGDAYGFLGDRKQCLRYCQRALDRARTIGNTDLILETLPAFASALLDLEEFDRAISTYRDLLAFSASCQHYQGAGEALMGLGDTYFQQKDYENAVTHYQNAEAVFNVSGDAIGLAQALAGNGTCLTTLGKLDEAENRLQMALRLSTQHGEPFTQVNIHRQMGHLYESKGSRLLSRYHHECAVQIAQDKGIEALETLARESLVPNEQPYPFYTELEIDKLMHQWSQALAFGSQEQIRLLETELRTYEVCAMLEPEMRMDGGGEAELHEWMATMAVTLAKHEMFERAVYYAEKAIDGSYRQGKASSQLVSLLTQMIGEWKKKRRYKHT